MTDGYTYVQLISQWEKISGILIGTPLSIVGIFGNAICIAVFVATPRLVAPTTRRLLLVNSLVSILFLTCSQLGLHPYMFCKPSCSVAWFIYNPVVVSLGMATITGLEMARNWTIAIIGFERYFLICHPIVFKSRWSLPSLRITTSAIWLASAASRAPLLIAFVLNANSPSMCPAAEIVLIVSVSLDALLKCFLPLSLLVCCSIALIKERRRRFHLPQRTPKVKKWYRSNQVLLILLCTQSVFSIPFIFDASSRLAMAVSIREHRYKDLCNQFFLTKIFNSLCYLGSVLMSASVLPIYLVFWRSFRRTIVTTATACGGRLRCCKSINGKKVS